MNRGKAVILGIFALALVAAGAAWWVQFTKGRQSLAFWGADAAWLIRQGDEIELLVFDPPFIADESQRSFAKAPVSQRRDLSHVPGVTHARQALISDTSYVWPPAQEILGETKWEYALTFSEDGRSETVLFHLSQSGRAKLASGSEEITLGEILRNGLQVFFNEAVGQPAAP